MGKLSILNRNCAKVMQEHSVKKNASRAPLKRILILRRRLSALLEEKESWEAKNQELIDGLNKEKKLNSELKKQVFNWQRLYHEAIISLNTFKVKHADTMQNISSCLKDMNIAFPHLVGLSDIMRCNKIRLTSQLNSLRTSETENYLPKAFGDSGQLKDFASEREKRRKHKVGPMVKGVLIQKPTIRLERVMLHQPQGHEPANSDVSPTGTNTLTPITEENEQEANLHLGQISMRRRRKLRLGSGERWRMRKKEQLEKERQIERERKRESGCSSVAEESSDSDNHLGPRIRLKRVSGLLLSPKLLEVERGRANEGKGATSRTSEPESHRLRAGEDPMEGCSWMNINLKHSTNKKDPEEGKTQCPVTPDSSDGESDTLNVSDQENMCSNLKISLYENQTFKVCRKTSSSSLSGDMSQEASDFSRPEPDSTSNIVFTRASSSTRDFVGNSSSASSLPACKQLAYSDTTSGVSRTQQEQESCGNESQTSSGMAPLTVTEHVRSSQDQRRSSGFCNNCTSIPSPDVQTRRIRKPKIHLYPGEESNNPKNVVCKAKKRKPIVKSTSKVPISRLSASRKSLGKRSVKKSFETPINSSVSMDQSSSQGESDRRSSRRTRGPVTYKESPLNVKMRRQK